MLQGITWFNCHCFCASLLVAIKSDLIFAKLPECIFHHFLHLLWALCTISVFWWMLQGEMRWWVKKRWWILCLVMKCESFNLWLSWDKEKLWVLDRNWTLRFFLCRTIDHLSQSEMWLVYKSWHHWNYLSLRFADVIFSNPSAWLKYVCIPRLPLMRQVKIQLSLHKWYVQCVLQAYLAEQFPPGPTPSEPVQVLLVETVTSEFLLVCYLCQTFSYAYRVAYVLQ